MTKKKYWKYNTHNTRYYCREYGVINHSAILLRRHNGWTLYQRDKMMYFMQRTMLIKTLFKCWPISNCQPLRRATNVPYMVHPLILPCGRFTVLIYYAFTNCKNFGMTERSEGINVVKYNKALQFKCIEYAHYWTNILLVNSYVLR
jgi:hypothetical protein